MIDIKGGEKCEGDYAEHYRIKLGTKLLKGCLSL